MKQTKRRVTAETSPGFTAVVTLAVALLIAALVIGCSASQDLFQDVEHDVEGADQDTGQAGSGDNSQDGSYGPAPAAPSDFSVRAVSSTEIELTWIDNSDDEEYFEIERTETSDYESYDPVATVDADVTTYLDTGLTAETEYDYRIRAVNSGGVSDWLGAAIATTLPPPLENVVAVAAGISHSLALRDDGSVYAWGDNGYRQLGNDSDVFSATPVLVEALSGIVDIASGENHCLAVDGGGNIWTWGDNTSGQLGTGDTGGAALPERIAPLADVVDVAAGPRHSVAVDTNGNVWAWGAGSIGQLGNGAFESSPIPVKIPSGAGAGVEDATKVAAGRSHSLALRSSAVGSDLRAWGGNFYGQLGDGSTEDAGSPVEVMGLSGVETLAAGHDHSLALRSDGTVWAWGDNSVGQLGTGSLVDSHVPTQVSSLSGIVSVAAGGGGSYAVDSSGALWAWGIVYGLTETHEKTLPVEIVALSNVLSVAQSDAHGLALLEDGTVWAWGSNNSAGQLGDGSMSHLDTSEPVRVVAPVE